MKQTTRNIGKIVLIYIVFVVVLNMLCALVLKKIYNNFSYFHIFIDLLCNSNKLGNEDQIFLNLVVAFKNLIGGIALAILASFIFTYILNKDVKIIFPDKIVLRRRTSEGSEGKLTLGVLIGNPGKALLCDVRCNINCTYIKQIGAVEQRNSETFLDQTVETIINYFRFSFDIEKLPKIFWKHYLEKGEDYLEKDAIIVTITGKTLGLGGYFRASKKYTIQDIIVDTHAPEKYFKRKVNQHFLSREQYKIDWKKFPLCIEASEEERENIIDEIRNYTKS